MSPVYFYIHYIVHHCKSDVKPYAKKTSYGMLKNSNISKYITQLRAIVSEFIHRTQFITTNAKYLKNVPTVPYKGYFIE